VIAWIVPFLAQPSLTKLAVLNHGFSFGANGYPYYSRRRKRRINILKKLRADYSRDEHCILFREAMVDDGHDDDDDAVVVQEETVARLPQSAGPKESR
jgi:hypothetical protein